MAAPDWLTARPVAHRGYHDASVGRMENTLPAAEAALARRFAIECDLQLTADGEIIVFHDDTLDRLTTGTGPVAARSLAEIRALRFHAVDAGVPTLSDLLDLVDGRTPLLIELKSQFKSDRRLEKAVAPVLAAYSGPAVVMSFDPMSMIAMRRLAPSLPRGMIADRFKGADWKTLALPARVAFHWLLAAPLVLPTFIAFDVHSLPASAPLALRHFFRVPLLTWTVRTEADRAIARAWADQIIFEGFDPDAA